VVLIRAETCWQGLSVVSNPETAAAINLPKQKVSRRRLKRSQSLVSQIFRRRGRGRQSDEAEGGVYGDLDDDGSASVKNVRQTELLVDLKQAVLRIARHFVATDPHGHQQVETQVSASYTHILHSQSKRQENHIQVNLSAFQAETFFLISCLLNFSQV